jgi:Tissue inhibitor of metalloproteinase
MKKAYLIIFIFSLAITKTFACSCIGTNESLSKKVQKSFNQSDLILIGKVIDKELIFNEEYQSSADPVIYKFEVTKIIKGKLKKEIIEIASERSEISCGYEFEIGKSYLVYALRSSHFSSITKNEFDLVTSLCSRNQKLSKVKKEELRKLKKLAGGIKK